MKIFRQVQKRTLLFWAVLLSLSILCAQGVKLHVHDFDHGDDNHHESLDAGNSDHLHLAEIHLAHDKSHIDHHGGTIPELDISPDGLLKKVSGAVLTLALLAAFVFFLLPASIRQTCAPWRDSKIPLPKRYFHSPPLRAPPHS